MIKTRKFVAKCFFQAYFAALLLIVTTSLGSGCFVQTKWYPNVCEERRHGICSHKNTSSTREECCKKFHEGVCDEEESANSTGLIVSSSDVVEGCWMVHTYWPDRTCKFTRQLCDTYHTVFTSEKECCERIHNGKCTSIISDAAEASKNGRRKCWQAGLWWPQRTCIEIDDCDKKDNLYGELFFSEDECCQIVHGHVGGCTSGDDEVMTQKALEESISKRLKELEELQKNSDFESEGLSIYDIMREEEEKANELEKEIVNGNSADKGNNKDEDEVLSDEDKIIAAILEEAHNKLTKTILDQIAKEDNDLDIEYYGGSNRQFTDDDEFYLPKPDVIPQRPN